MDGYTAAATGNVKRLTGTGSGNVMVKNEPKLCCASTWKLVEVSDFRTQLEGLVNKCNRIVETPLTGAYGEPTAEAVAYLQENLIAPAQKVLNQNDVVTEVTYKTYVSVYNQFLAMPRTSILDGISEEYYYRMENGYFTNYYAYAGTVNVEPRTLEADADGFLWYFVKQEDGTLKIYSKVTNNPAYISSSAEGQTIKVNVNAQGIKDWTLEEISTDQSNSGIAIVDPSGEYSWYTNPSAFSTILTKPKSWGASIWNLIKTDQKVTLPSGIEQVTTGANTEYYDLSGRRVSHPQKGIYIQHGKKIVVE